MNYSISQKICTQILLCCVCCGHTLTDFPIYIRLTSLTLWQSNDCPSASKATLMNMDKYFMWIHYEWLHNHNKAKHNKTVCIFLGIYCRSLLLVMANHLCSPIAIFLLNYISGYLKCLLAQITSKMHLRKPTTVRIGLCRPGIHR